MGTPAVTVNKAGGGVAVVTLAKEPVNSMDLDLWRRLQGALNQCEQDPEVRRSTHSHSGFEGGENHDTSQHGFAGTGHHTPSRRRNACLFASCTDQTLRSSLNLVYWHEWQRSCSAQGCHSLEEPLQS